MITVLDDHDADPVAQPQRDTVSALGGDAQPTIVSISDIHGHVRQAREALLTLSDHPEYDPIVDTDVVRRLQWVGGEEYVLVFNGDLTDRGAHSDQVVEMVERLIDQAPPGHVRVTLGNHEMGVLTPDRFDWDRWYSGQRDDDQRRGFVQQILDGHVVAAYDGYHVTYAHAGREEPYDTARLNDRLVSAAEKMAEVIGTPADADAQREIIEGYPEILGLGGRTGRGPNAGIAWLDFEFMPDDAPRQVVGHTRQDKPVRRGNVVCQNTIRNNRRSDGGEAVVVETPDRLLALGRDEDGDVLEHEFSLPRKKPQEASG